MPGKTVSRSRAATLGCGLVFAVLAGALSAPLLAADEERPQDWLDVANGAMVLSVTSQYDQGRNSALSTISGHNGALWYTKRDDVGPQSILYELVRPVRIETFAIDNTGIDSKTRGARNFELYGAAESRDGPYVLLASGEAQPYERVEFPVSAAGPARWLRLDVKDNWGDGRYIEISELEAYGAPGELPARDDISGNYETNFNMLRLRQSGSDVTGCYDWQGGTLSGETDGRVVRFQWHEPAQIGTAIMVLSQDKDLLNGLYYENGQFQGAWWGRRAAEGKEAKCQLADDSLDRTIADMKRAVLYGIRFDFDSDRLRADSADSLNALKAALERNADWRLRIEGHTDSDGGDDYNLELSQRRAAAVKAWLVDHGIAAARLEPQGFGEAKPVGSNETPQGRALNRRVEVSLL